MKTCHILGAAALLLAVSVPAAAAGPQPSISAAASASYQEIEATFGFVPTFMRSVPPAALPGAWAEMKSLQLSKTTALPGKTKELIGLAVAAQIPCQYCIFFHTLAAKGEGATEEEVQEAVAMASITRHWSTILNGNQVDEVTFKQEVERIMGHH